MQYGEHPMCIETSTCQQCDGIAIFERFRPVPVQYNLNETVIIKLFKSLAVKWPDNEIHTLHPNHFRRFGCLFVLKMYCAWHAYDIAQCTMVCVDLYSIHIQTQTHTHFVKC